MTERVQVNHSPASPCGLEGTGVLAVLVVYGRPLEQVAAWPRLQSWLTVNRDTPAAPAKPADGTGFQLRHVLIYDNSTRLQSHPPAHEAITVQHNPGNGGTRAAYLHAMTLARGLNLPWLLLLDHDTALPADYFTRLTAAACNAQGAPCVAWLPVVACGARSISPATVQASGAIRPVAGVTGPWNGSGPLTGVASGSLLATTAMSACPPPPARMWLDGVDHWYFLQLQRRGGRVGAFSAVLSHDLSIHDLASLSVRRAQSILVSLRCLLAILPWPARVWYPVRVLWFLTKLCRKSPSVAFEVLRRGFSAGGPHE